MLGTVLALIGVFFVGTLGFVAVVGLAVGLLAALILFVVPKRWRRAIIQATPAFWPAPIRQKYPVASSEAAPNGCVDLDAKQGTASSRPERLRGLNTRPELHGRRLLGLHGFSQADVQDIEDDESVWLLEFEGGWWAELVTQIAPAWISPTFQLAWDVYAPTIAKPAMADCRIAHLPDAFRDLIGTRFMTVGSCVSTENIVLEDRLIFEVQTQGSSENVLVLRLGYLKAAEGYLRTGKLDDLGNQGLDAQVVTPSKIAEMDAWELRRKMERPMRYLGPVVLEQWLVPTHFPACAAPWDDAEQVQRLRVLRQALTEFLKWFRPSHKMSDGTVADRKRPELKWSWTVQLAVLEEAWERIAAWELLVNAGLAVNPDTGELFAAAREALERGDDLRGELPVMGLGTLFTPTWWVNTAECELDDHVPAGLDVARVRSGTAPMWIAGTGTVPSGLVGQEIPQDFLWAQDMLKRYEPVRQAYRHWFAQFRECHMLQTERQVSKIRLPQ